MNTSEFLTLCLALLPYLVIHTIIVGMLLRLRRRLPLEQRKVSPWLLASTALPIVGPLLSSLAFARLARCIQSTTNQLFGYRSDCGFVAGIAYGLMSLVATWFRSPSLGGLTLVLLLLALWQMSDAVRGRSQAV